MDKLIKNIQIIVIIALFIGIVFLVASAIIANKRILAIEKQLVHIGEEIDEANTGVKRILNKSSALLVSEKIAKAEMDILEYDFGKIKKVDGVVSKKFTLSNSGREKLVIGDITTSCGCTTAKVDKKEAESGEKIIIEVKFDPNFHEEPKGRFSRSIFIPTNDPVNNEIELKIFMEILEN